MILCSKIFVKNKLLFFNEKKVLFILPEKKKSFLNALVKGYGQKAKKEKCLRPNKNWIPIIM